MVGCSIEQIVPRVYQLLEKQNVLNSMNSRLFNESIPTYLKKTFEIYVKTQAKIAIFIVSIQCAGPLKLRIKKDNKMIENNRIMVSN